MDPYINIQSGIQVPVTIHNGDFIFRLANKDSQLILTD